MISAVVISSSRLFVLFINYKLNNLRGICG
jgi:hypothetical protein